MTYAYVWCMCMCANLCRRKQRTHDTFLKRSEKKKVGIMERWLRVVVSDGLVEVDGFQTTQAMIDMNLG